MKLIILCVCPEHIFLAKEVTAVVDHLCLILALVHYQQLNSTLFIKSTQLAKIIKTDKNNRKTQISVKKQSMKGKMYS